MTQASDPNDFPREIERRFGHLNRRLERLEDTQISPQEFARAFERVNGDTTQIKREISDLRTEMNTKIDALGAELNAKIDTIATAKDVRTLQRLKSPLGMQSPPTRTN
jgi:chromosome segregation ATPase